MQDGVEVGVVLGVLVPDTGQAAIVVTVFAWLTGVFALGAFGVTGGRDGEGLGWLGVLLLAVSTFLVAGQDSETQRADAARGECVTLGELVDELGRKRRQARESGQAMRSRRRSRRTASRASGPRRPRRSTGPSRT